MFALAMASLVALTPVEPVVGQWVWAPRDLLRLEQARTEHPGVVAAIHVADLSWDGEVKVHLRLPPDAAAHALVIRIEDSFHRALSEDPVRAERSLEAALVRVLLATERAGARTRRLQLDYDAPVRLLPRWAALLRRLCEAPRALAGREVWMTTLVAHVREPGFGALFAGGWLAGHVVQLFDSAEAAPDAEALARWLERAGLPFAVGIGAFDRFSDGVRRTNHSAPLASLPRLKALPAWRGVWVFPAGESWLPLARGLR